MGSDLLLDPQIRLLVLVPIIVVTFLTFLARHYVTPFLQSATVKVEKITEKQTLMRSRMLRMNGRFIPLKGFEMRKAYFNADKTGLLTAKSQETAPVANPMTDPDMMKNMMTGNVVNMVPMVVIGGVINWVFSGFVTIKVPFPLTPRFKPMLQRGIELDALSASWVSSVSFYFICVFGLRGIFSLIVGEDSDADQARVMQQQMNGGGMQQQQDMPKAFKHEWEELQVQRHTWALQDIEAEAVKVMRKTHVSK